MKVEQEKKRVIFVQETAKEKVCKFALMLIHVFQKSYWVT